MMLRVLWAAACLAAALPGTVGAEQKPVQHFPLLKAKYTYAIPTGAGTLTVNMSVPSVLPIDINDGHSLINQPVFATFTLSPEKSRASVELDLPHHAADPVADRFRDPGAARFVEAFARSIMSVSACYGGDIGVQSVAGRYRRVVAERETLKAQARQAQKRTGAPLAVSAAALPVRMESRRRDFIVWKADMTCSFWRNPAARRQLARLHRGLDIRTRDPLAKIRAETVWETARNHSFGTLPQQPGTRVGPRWGEPRSRGLYVKTVPGVPRSPGLLRANP